MVCNRLAAQLEVSGVLSGLHVASDLVLLWLDSVPRRLLGGGSGVVNPLL